MLLFQHSQLPGPKRRRVDEARIRFGGCARPASRRCGDDSVPKIEFSNEEKQAIVRNIQLYFREELDQEIGQFDAEFLLEFFTDEIGPYFYNRGLYDAQAILETRLENIGDAIYELEQPTDFSK